MLPRAVGTRAVVVGVVALCVASVVACGGGGRDSVTGPATIASGALNEGGTLGESAASQIVVCHKGQDLAVAGSAVSAHLGHGDKLGSCAAVCPCFTSQGINSLAATCSIGLVAQCPAQYSLQLYCSPGPFSSNLGYFEARLGTSSCMSITQDALTGNLVRAEKVVSSAEYDACRAAIVMSTPYQSTSASVCPR